MRRQEQDDLLGQVKVFNETIWEGKANELAINEWLRNFGGETLQDSAEKQRAMHLLSRFTYFGSREIKEALKAIYRDLVVYPLIARIRRTMKNTSDRNLLRRELDIELEATRFLGAGNPSESGAHLLYFFRQENRLKKRFFIHAQEAIDHLAIASDSSADGDKAAGNGSNPRSKWRRFVFIDDFCGSGTQAVRYVGKVASVLKKYAPDCEVAFHALAGTSWGLERVRKEANVDQVGCVIELDSSFRCFEPDSRYFDADEESLRVESRGLCERFGAAIYPSHPLGFEDGQLLVAFSHNTPNNTLPIFWAEKTEVPWVPIFRRYPKSLSSDQDA